MRAFLILIITSIISLSCQSQNTDLSFKLEKGKEYKHISSAKISLIQEINGNKVNMVMTVNSTLNYLVKDITERGYEMDTKFEELSMTMQLPQGTMSFSSEKNDKNDIFSTILGAMKNKIFNITMSKTGKVSEVKNIENLWESAINKFGQLSEIQKEQIKAQVIKAYGPKAVKGSIEQVTSIYPENPVNKGDKWTISTNLESGIPGKMNTEYEYAELTPNYALIKGNSTIVTADKDAYIKFNGMPMKYDLKGSMTSEIKVDKNTGWIIEATTHQKITGIIHIKGNPQFPYGMNIPMTMISETHIKI